MKMVIRYFFVGVSLVFFVQSTLISGTQIKRGQPAQIPHETHRQTLEKRDGQIGKALSEIDKLIHQRTQRGMTKEQMTQWGNYLKWMKSVRLRLNKYLIKSKRIVIKKGHTSSPRTSRSAVPATALLDTEYNSLMKDIEKEYKLQQQQNRLTQMANMKSNMAARAHQTMMSIINNLRA